jgi:dTDP-4-dehydrorhamnose reductase
MKILVTGANGQLGSELKDLAPEYKNYEFTFIDIEDLDITDNSKVESYFKKNKFEVIINCAAYTAVDKAESEKEKTTALNSTAVKLLTEMATKQKALFVHISTDYVFDGRNFKPYLETDLTNPRSFYGKSKLDGEVEVLFNAYWAVVIRTSWLYSSYGNNFVKTMMNVAKEKGVINVVSDQIGTPTYAADLAKAILDIIPKVKPKSKFEIYNYSNEGVCSWYDFAQEIMALTKSNCKINPIETKEYPTAAVRPHYSVLNKSKIKKEFGISIPYWRYSLEKCIKKLS